MSGQTYQEKKWIKDNRGVVLIASLGLVTTISLLSMTMLGQSLVEWNNARRQENRLIAFHLTEGAVDQTIVALRANPNFAGFPGTSTPEGGFQTTVCSQANPNGCANPAAPPLVNTFLIQASGFTGGANGFGFVQRRIDAVVRMIQPPPFNFSLFADSSIQMSGNAMTDAYDSRNGPYNSLTATQDGDIGTNASSDGSIELITVSGNVTVKGDAVVGPGSNVANAITTNGNAVITGNKIAASSTTALDPVLIPSQIPSSGNLVVNSNDPVNLAGGIYVFDSLQITGNGQLNFTGPATLYVAGSVTIDGNGVGSSQNLPTNLFIFVAGINTVQISGNGNLYAAIYAPDSSVQFSGNGEVFGGVVGDSIANSGNAIFHYDKALSEVATSQPTPRLMAWTER
jgi:hypothetical protein